MAWAIPTTTPQVLREGQSGVHVWALQRCLNSFEDLNYGLVEDGLWPRATATLAPRTTAAVKDYQRRTGLDVDGIAGPATQSRLVRSLELRMDSVVPIPEGLIQSVVRGESGAFIAAVNWAVAGGVDCGYTQRRILAPYTDDEIEWAFDSMLQVRLLGTQLSQRQAAFIMRPGVAGRADRQTYAWRLAVLYHNWPYAADRLADGHKLSTTTEAWWVPDGVKFDDGAPVVSFADWAAFYSMGSKTHKHEGRMVALTNFGVPNYG